MTRNGKHLSRRLTVRRALLRDLDALVHQRRAMWEDMGVGTTNELDEADRAYRKWARPRLKSGKLVAWIVENDNREIVGGGTLWLQPTQPWPGAKVTIRPYLLSMYTEPEFRRMGVASSIVKEAVKWSKKNGYSALLLHASKIGRRLYPKLGFKRTWEMRLRLRHEHP